MRSQRLAGGDHAAVSILEVVRIPDASTLGEAFLRADPQAAMRREFGHLLDEVASVQLNAEVSLEVVMRAVSVTGQPYEAEIRSFLACRALHTSSAAAVDAADTLTRLVEAMLVSTGYDAVRAEQEPRILYGFGAPVAVAVRRRARIITVPSAVIPPVYVYDRIPKEPVALHRLFTAMTACPGAFVSVQLTRTHFTQDEKEFIDQAAMELGALERGASPSVLGGVSHANLRRPAATYDYYNERSARPVFAQSVVVGGDRQQTTLLSSMLMGALSSASDEGSLDLAMVEVDPRALGLDRDDAAAPWRVTAVLDEVASALISPESTGPVVDRLPSLVTVEEASQLARLPVATEQVGAGFQVSYTAHRSRAFLEGVVAPDLEVGHLGQEVSGVALGFSLLDLTRHAFVTGTPGSGKSTFNVGLLDRLWREHHIPFLVIEPAKNEYRALVETIPELQVFTPGKRWLSPLVLNPFLPPDGVRLENHKSSLKTAFSAALTMAPPLDRLFEMALDRMYVDRGWLESDTLSAGHPVPMVRDLVTAFRTVMDEVGYTGEAANIGRAGLVRLASMVKTFDTTKSIPMQDLVGRPTVIELAAIENSSDKTLYIALLLLRLLSHCNANVTALGELRQVLLLEEAHVLFDAVDSSADGAASPAAVAQALLKRMLAEMRSYGVGIVVTDQSPRKVTADVLALTNIKVAFRLVEREDRELLGNSANMSTEQVQRLSGLRTGEALLFHDRLAEPEEVRTVDLRSRQGISTTLTDETLAPRLRYFQDNPDLLRPYPECEVVNGWDPGFDDIAKQFAERIFRSKDDPMTSASWRGTYQNLQQRASSLDPRYPVVDGALLDMVRVHFLRLVRYETDLDISEIWVASVLKATMKMGGDAA